MLDLSVITLNYDNKAGHTLNYTSFKRLFSLQSLSAALYVQSKELV
jgi:hypothetical protein